MNKASMLLFSTAYCIVSLTIMSKQKQILQEFLVKMTKEQLYENSKIIIEPITSNGSNYTSKLFYASISAKGKENLDLFAKVSAIGENKISSNEIFKTETYFYKTLLVKYKELEEKNIVTEKDKLRTPKFHGSGEEFSSDVIVLENLAAKEYQVADRLKPVNPKYALKSVQQLAQLHALSLALAVHQPEYFEQVKKVLQVNMTKSVLLEFVNSLIGKTFEATKEEYKEVVKNFVDNVLDEENLDKLLTPPKKLVINHGDFRACNLMYKMNNNVTEIIVMDFQTLFFGSPVTDLLYFIINGADKNFLDNWYEDTLNHYFLELRSALRNLNVDPDEAYTRQDFNDELKLRIPVCLVIGFCSLLVVTVDLDKAPKLHEEFAMQDFAVTPSDIYKQRLNDIIEFFMDKGVI